MIRAAVIGATGYAGFETVRILAGHPDVNIVSLASHSFAGKKYSEVYPSMAGVVDSVLAEDSYRPDADVVFASLPHGVSQDTVASLVEAGTRVIDLSGDYRYKSAGEYEKAYGLAHKHPEILAQAVYGLTELYREQIRGARLVANPGCYPTTSVIGLAPLLAGKLISTDNIIIDSVSGVSGAGRTTELPYQFCELEGNFKAYKVTGHRHTSEIEQELSLLAGKPVAVSFTPHLAPFKRGMLSTIYANLAVPGMTGASLREACAHFYKGEKFVRVLEAGKLPETKFVAGSNYIDVGAVVDERLNRAIILVCQDNLGKGAAGQAVQNMNVMFGLPEERGLGAPGLYL